MRFFIGFAVLLSLSFSSGCQTITYTFRLVDAKSHQPLDGVSTFSYSQGAYWHMRGFDHTDSQFPPPTGPDGLVTIAHLRPEPDFDHHFIFTRSGYASAS